MFGPHFLLHTVSTKAFYRSPNEQLRFIERIAKRVTRIAKNNQISRLRHEGRHMTDIAMDDNVDAFH
jgi:hypothetical protein